MKSSNKGCFYWLLIGWWLEPVIWIFKFIYWLCIGWWGNIFSNRKSATGCLTGIILLGVIGAILTYWPIAICVIVVYIICLIIKYKNRYCNINIDTMTGNEFEHFCADLLRDNGFTNVNVTPSSGDHGIDVIANKNGLKYAVQCKCYSNNVGNKAVQEAYSGRDIYGADIAVVITNRAFTAQAKSDAEQLGVQLWDREELLRFLRIAEKKRRKQSEKHEESIVISESTKIRELAIETEQNISSVSESDYRTREKQTDFNIKGDTIEKMNIPVPFPASPKAGKSRDKIKQMDIQNTETKRAELADDILNSVGSKDGECNSSQKQTPCSSLITSVEVETSKTSKSVRMEYVYPTLNLLKRNKEKLNFDQNKIAQETAVKLQQILESFGVRATVIDVSCGPVVTRYELLPQEGVKVSRIVGLADDIKLNLAAADIRIEAPIPGKAAVGIEVPNAENSAVALRDLLESDEFQNHPSKLAFATGKDIEGKAVVSDIAKMSHVLIAGATGSGKSVCINTLIMSILYKASPDEVQLIMVDPKVVELNIYNGIPHLLIPVVTDSKKAAGALNWAVAEMMSRYDKFAEAGVRDLEGYNKKIEAIKGNENESVVAKLPQILIIIDEFADMMLTRPWEIEDAICTLGRKGHIVGIHMVIATRKLSSNVVTDLIKTNIPSRIAFSVSTKAESNMILGVEGAEKLLGNGDMLFRPRGIKNSIRVQGSFVSDEELADVVNFLKNKNADMIYSTDAVFQNERDLDALFADAGKFFIDKGKASIGMLQRVFKIGFNRAARIMDQLSDAGVVGPEEGTKPRKILMSAEEFENYLKKNW